MPAFALKSILLDERHADSARDVNLYVNCSLRSVQNCGMMEILCVQIWNLHIKSSSKKKSYNPFLIGKLALDFCTCHALA